MACLLLTPQLYAHLGQRLLVRCSSPEEAQRLCASVPEARTLWPVHARSSALRLAYSQAESQSIESECRSWVIVGLTASSNSDSMALALRAQFRPRSVQRSRVWTLDANGTDSLRSKQWALDKLKAEQVWKRATGSGVVVAIIDTGIDWLHPDLASQFHCNAAEDLNNNGRFDPWPAGERRDGVSGDIDSIDNDANGFVDDVIGYNFVDQATANLGHWHQRDAFPYDEVGHGTNVAGVIAASHNNVTGISGLAFDAKLMILRAFDISGNAEEDDIASAVLYAVDNGARVINCSFGDVVRSSIVRDAMRYAAAHDVLVIASSGNTGGSEPHYPSDFASCMSVGASTPDDKRTLFSSFGTQLSLIAPGQSILTTALDGDYATVSGTSFSAPLTSAAAAVLLSSDTSLSAEDLRGTLELNAWPLDSLSWSPTTGAGRLDLLRSLERRGSVRAFISAPEVDAIVHRSSRSEIEIIGCVNVPLLRSWSVEIANSNNLLHWKVLRSSSERVLDSTILCSLPLNTLDDSTYVVRLRIELSNGRSLQRSTRFSVLASDITASLQSYAVWTAGRRMLGVELHADRPCTVEAEVYNDSTHRSAHSFHLGLDHFLLLSTTGVSSEATLALHVRSVDGDTALFEVQQNVEDAVVQDTCFSAKPYTAQQLYLNPQSIDTLSRRFLATDLSKAERPLGTFEVNNGTVRRLELTNKTLFSRGMTKSTQSAELECLVYSGGQTSVQRVLPDGKLGTVVFGDSARRDLWACRFSDVDGDGFSDVLAYRSNRSTVDSLGRTVPLNDEMQLFRATDGGYSFASSCKSVLAPAIFRAASTFSGPGCAVGDFDHDGRQEIAFCDGNGSLQISEWSGNQFSVEKVVQNTAIADAGTEFCTEADVDGDGTPEILYGYPASSLINFNGEYDASQWVFHLLKSTGTNAYKEVWTDHFNSSRYGKPYFNGIAAGDLDGIRGQEIALSLFPSLYVFRWSASKKTLEPFWYHDNAWSNSPMIADFDGNGKNEIAFSSSENDSCQWWELSLDSVRPAPPTNLRLRALSTDSVQLQWTPNPVAQSTSISFGVLDANNTVVLRQIVKGSTDRVNVQRRIGYHYEVQGWSQSSASDTSTGPMSRKLVQYDGGDIIARSCEEDKNLENVLRVRFNSSIQNTLINSVSWNVHDDRGQRLHVLSSLIESDSVLLLGLSPIDPQAKQLSLSLHSFIEQWHFPPIYATLSCEHTVHMDSCCRFGFKRLLSVSDHAVEAEFSEGLDVSSLDVARFRLSPDMPLMRVTALNDSRSILRFEIDKAFHFAARGFVYRLKAVPSLMSTTKRLIGSGAESELAWSTAAEAESEVFAFPQPFSMQKDEVLHFAGVPQGARVAIKTIEGVFITSLSSRLADGGVEWNPLQEGGALLQSGVYLFSIVAADGSESELRTFLLQR